MTRLVLLSVLAVLLAGAGVLVVEAATHSTGDLAGGVLVGLGLLAAWHSGRGDQS